MRTLTQAEFTAYARRQIETAHAMIAGHQPSGGGLCSCGTQLPCSVAEACGRTRDHFQGKLALLEATVRLPVLAPPAATPRLVSLWRRLLGGR